MKVILTILILLVLALLFWVYKEKRNKELDTAIYERRISDLEDEAIKQERLVEQFQEKVKEYEEHILTVSDEAPVEDTIQGVALKLSNEIAPYVKKADGKISLTLFVNEKVNVEKPVEPVDEAPVATADEESAKITTGRKTSKRPKKKSGN